MASPTVTPTPHNSLKPTQPQKFDAAFIDRRMREHREWQDGRQRQLAAGIIREVLGLEDPNGSVN